MGEKFDDRLKERAQAQDAVDRLEILRTQLTAEHARREAFRDLAARLCLLVAISVLVMYAVSRL